MEGGLAQMERRLPPLGRQYVRLGGWRRHDIATTKHAPAQQQMMMMRGMMMMMIIRRGVGIRVGAGAWGSVGGGADHVGGTRGRQWDRPVERGTKNSV